MYDTMFFSFFQRYLYHTNGMLVFPPSQPLRMNKSIVLIKLMERARAAKTAGRGAWPELAAP